MTPASMLKYRGCPYEVDDEVYRQRQGGPGHGRAPGPLAPEQETREDDQGQRSEEQVHAGQHQHSANLR